MTLRASNLLVLLREFMDDHNLDTNSLSNVHVSTGIGVITLRYLTHTRTYKAVDTEFQNIQRQSRIGRRPMYGNGYHLRGPV